VRVPASWLTEHLELDRSVGADELADAFVRIGVEVEDTVSLDQVSGPLVVARVVEIEELAEFKKPIRYCHVDVGEFAASGDADVVTKTRGIVCGATNFAEGDLVVAALPGAVLPGDFEISARSTYGRTSDGMICSVHELGLGEDHTGILVLPPGTADPGDDAREILELTDTVLELTPTPDRGYELAVRGLARELAGALDVDFRDPGLVELPAADDVAWPVRIADSTACGRFVVRRVTNLDVGAPTPFWMRRRLLVAGIRPISLAVDVTNYVMLELGQPLHAWDAASVDGELVVRRAWEGERLTTLDGMVRELAPADIVIADDNGAASLAGTMGGASTEIGSASGDVLIEAAHWDPSSISRTARAHKLFSEAAKRFERFVDPEVCGAAAERVARLLQRYGDANVQPGRTDVGHVEPMPAVTIPINMPDRVAGVRYERGVTVRRLGQIGCTVSLGTGDDGVAVVAATPPSWRNDLVQQADLVEEVLRLEGYDSIPSVLPTAPAGGGLGLGQRARRSACRALAEAGYVEVLPFPFVEDSVWDAFGLPQDDTRRRTATVLNPLESDRAQLATTLLPGLLETLQRNLARGMRDLALYTISQVVLPESPASAVPEVGTASRPSDEQLRGLFDAVPPQPRHAAVVLSGQRAPAGWWGNGEQASWADAIQAARTIAEVLGVELDIEAAEYAPWHPGRCARLSVSGKTVGHAGELHPQVIDALGLPRRTAAMELDFDALPVAANRPAPEISAYPPVLLDVALVVDDGVSAAEVERTLRTGAGELLEHVRLFDVYTGQQLGEGKRSLAFSLRFRAPDRTMAGEEATRARDAAVRSAEQRLGAQLRSG